MDEDLENFIKLSEEYSPGLADYSESINLINRLFDDYLIPNIRNRSWNMGIKIARRGAQLYTDQQFSKRELNLLHVISDRLMQDCVEIIKGKSILIFDDSIKEGSNVRRVLDEIMPLASDITVAVLLSRSDTLENLKSEYPHVKFHCEIITSENNFGKEYLKKIQPYLDSICLPLQNNHPLLSISFDNSFTEQTVIDIFNKYGFIKDDDCKKFEYIDGDKTLFEFSKEMFDELQIFENMKKLGIMHKDTELTDAIIIRLYIRKGLVRRLIMQPIILEGFVTGDDSIELIDKFVKSQIIYQFLISKILANLIRTDLKILRFSVILD